jgi:PhzF family phenazine biosynthesis protein
MAINYYLLDTFTKEKFKGNPTPVCILEQTLSVQLMHSFAKEFNCPVTAFVEPKNELNFYPIRYFTITGEIPACGHATLGAAFVLFNKTQGNQIIFETVGKVQLQAKQDKELTFIEYPKLKRREFIIPTALEEALGLKKYETHFFCDELESLFIELKSENEVRQLSPDFKLLIESCTNIKEVVVMSKAENQNYDFVLRSFCPWIGIDEDPVTGSVHSVLGSFWQDRLSKNELIAIQVSERGGQLFINQLQDKVEIGGYAEIIIKGELKQ